VQLPYRGFVEVKMTAGIDELGSTSRHERSSGKKERLPIQHELKSWPEFFEPTRLGMKTHDLRRSDERDYRVGDLLILKEFDPKTNLYTGRQLKAEVTYITSADFPCALSKNALDPHYCILSIRKID
jgi:hypothetical protein